jgi:hypothetical protein
MIEMVSFSFFILFFFLGTFIANAVKHFIVNDLNGIISYNTENRIFKTKKQTRFL